MKHLLIPLFLLAFVSIAGSAGSLLAPRADEGEASLAETAALVADAVVTTDADAVEAVEAETAPAVVVAEDAPVEEAEAMEAEDDAAVVAEGDAEEVAASSTIEVAAEAETTPAPAARIVYVLRDGSVAGVIRSNVLAAGLLARLGFK